MWKKVFYVNGQTVWKLVKRYEDVKDRPRSGRRFKLNMDLTSLKASLVMEWN